MDVRKTINRKMYLSCKEFVKKYENDYRMHNYHNMSKNQSFINDERCRLSFINSRLKVFPEAKHLIEQRNRSLQRLYNLIKTKYKRWINL